MFVLATALSGCRLDMHDAPYYEPLEWSGLWEDGRSSRHPVEGTVPRGRLRQGKEDFYTAQAEDGQLLQTLPVGLELSEALLERGQDRYNVFCSPCHGYTGYGNGMIVQRGFKPPPSFHAKRLKESPVGYFYAIITNGYGAMYSYAASIKPEDRWAISAYVKALQLSQDMRVSDLSSDERALIGKGPVSADGAAHGDAHGGHDGEAHHD